MIPFTLFWISQNNRNLINKYHRHVFFLLAWIIKTNLLEILMFLSDLLNSDSPWNRNRNVPLQSHVHQTRPPYKYSYNYNCQNFYLLLCWTPKLPLVFPTMDPFRTLSVDFARIYERKDTRTSWYVNTFIEEIMIGMLKTCTGTRDGHTSSGPLHVALNFACGVWI